MVPYRNHFSYSFSVSCCPTRRKGFSLVELSIVLVVLGLLTGGILTGQNLIRSAEMRSIVSDFNRYQTAIMSFRDQFLYLPGDMPNATTFWGEMTNCGAASPSGTGTQTCNGNGNGEINAAATGSQTGEMFNAWQQLASAGLVEGTYNGIAGSGSDIDARVGINVPTGKIRNSGWTLLHVGSIGVAHNTVYEGEYGNALYFGTALNGTTTSHHVITPKEAWGIDKKIDDGKAGIGRLRMFENHGRADGTGCTNVAVSTTVALANTSEYQLDNTNAVCAIVFANAY